MGDEGGRKKRKREAIQEGASFCLRVVLSERGRTSMTEKTFLTGEGDISTR